MNIAYSGCFLGAGLQKEGCHIFPIDLSNGRNIFDCLRELPHIDLVLLELYGAAIPPFSLGQCDVETAAYCIDSPINEFWLKDACALFDHVFVDQKTSVPALTKAGINSSWLPLGCMDAWFAEKAEKIHDITFIGRINANRSKRYNLVKLLSSIFAVNLAQDVSLEQASRIYSQSKIVLNENLFSGLTMRVFTGMCANALVFTEQGGAGVNDFFQDGVHLVEFTPGNVLETLGELLSAPGKCAEMAANGYDACKTRHSDSARAREFLAALSAKTAFNKRLDALERQWRKLCASASFGLRYGGQMQPVIKGLKAFGDGNDAYFSMAGVKLGDIYAQLGDYRRAELVYGLAIECDPDYNAFLKSALICAERGEPDKAKKRMDLALANFPKANLAAIETGNVLLRDDFERIFYQAARIRVAENRLFELGFNKATGKNGTDSAFDLARTLWTRRPSSLAMELMLQALAPYKLEGELLPEFMAGIRGNILSRKQILQAADAAMRYYDFETADRILKNKCH